MKFDYCIFDLDGTLTDSFEGIANSIAYALSHFGIQVGDRESLRPLVGPALRESFIEYYGFSRADAETALAKFREYYSDKGLFENRVYDGIPELLKKLCDSGAHVMTATAKVKCYTERILEHFGLRDMFEFIGAATMDGSLSKKSDIIKYVIDNAPITELSRAVMIGDRLHDVTGAQANRIHSIGVLYGYGDSAELNTADADFIADDVDSLSKILMRD